MARAGDNSPGDYGEGGGLELNGPGVFANITATAFKENQAIGGDGGSGQYVGEGAGGAIANYGAASIAASTFDQNQAIAGDKSDGGPGTADPSPDVAFSFLFKLPQPSRKLAVTRKSYRTVSELGHDRHQANSRH